MQSISYSSQDSNVRSSEVGSRDPCEQRSPKSQGQKNRIIGYLGVSTLGIVIMVLGRYLIVIGAWTLKVSYIFDPRKSVRKRQPGQSVPSKVAEAPPL